MHNVLSTRNVRIPIYLRTTAVEDLRIAMEGRDYSAPDAPAA